MEVSDPDRPIRADELAALIAATTPAPPSLGYLVAPGPRYALRLLRDESVFPPDSRRLAAGMPVDGATVLRLARPALVGGGLQLPAALPSSSAPFRPSGPWMEWDLVQVSTLRHETAATDNVAVGSVSSFRSEVLAGDAVGFVLDLRLEAGTPDDQNPSLLLPSAYLEIEGRPGVTGRTTSLRLGRQEVGAITTDGILLSLLSPSATIEVGTGYTGLVSTDLAALPPNPGEEPVDRPVGGGSFAPARIVTRGVLTLPEILERQTPSVAVTAVTDPDAPEDSLYQGELSVAARVAPSEERAALSMPYGRINATVRRADNGGMDFRVFTPISTAAVRGTEFGYDGFTLSVTEGDVAFTNRIGQAHSVREGQLSRTWGVAPIESVEQTLQEALNF
jgi:hypothetical protein